METLEHFADRSDLLKKPQVEQVRLLAWYLHSVVGKERIVTSDVRSCYQQLHLNAPNVSHYLSYLSDGKGRTFIRDKLGFRLEGRWRKQLEESLGESTETVAVKALLGNLVDKVTDPNEKNFLEEALRCYSVKAFRAAVVMSWNLAYSHFRSVIVSESTRLAAFNAAITVRYPKMMLQVSNVDDFEELKEFEAIEIAKLAKILSKNVSEIMKDKLKRRNIAAHPSSVDITQAQADDVITDLVNNVVLRIV